ncbi:MAG: RNA-binding protein [Acidobacteria bacterium]|jgi:cold-inducible RNA-binding protein|nr:RNA-binding protein [Acidobacteriota bacterium]
MKLYVGNLPYSVNDNVLRSTFEAYGAVESARVISDRETGQSKGFGFVEMADGDAQKAMSALNGQELDGRALRVNEARPQEPRTGGGGGGGGRGYGGGGGGGYGRERY